jgi:hypothetical protein
MTKKGDLQARSACKSPFFLFPPSRKEGLGGWGRSESPNAFYIKHFMLNVASAGWRYSAEAFAKGGDSDENNEGICVPVSVKNNNRPARCQAGWKVMHKS